MLIYDLYQMPFYMAEFSWNQHADSVVFWEICQISFNILAPYAFWIKEIAEFPLLHPSRMASLWATSEVSHWVMNKWDNHIYQGNTCIRRT